MNDLERTPRQADRYIGPANGSDPDVIEVPSGSPREDAGIFEYWHMVLRNKGTVLVVALLGAVGGFLMTLPSPRIYQARTTMEIRGLNGSFMNLGNVTATMADTGYDSVADLQTHMRVMQSRSLREQVSKTVSKQPMPADLAPQDRLGMWRRALNINPPSKDELWAQAVGMASGSVAVRNSGMNRIVEVSCDSTNRQVAADFCNTLTQQYIDQNLESRWKSTEYTGEFLTKQLQDLKVNIEKSQDELQAFLRETGLTVTTTDAKGETANAQEVRMNDLLKELSESQMDRIQKQSKYELVVAGSTSGIPEVLDDESLRSSQQTLLELKTKAAQLTTVLTPTNPEVKKIQAQIATIEASLLTERADILSRLRNEYEGARRREALIASNYQSQARLVSGQAEQIARYNLLKREVDAGRMLYDNLLQRTKEASVASALRANNIRVIDEARAPGAPYSPNVKRQIMMGLLFGVVLGIGLVVVKERADRTLQDPGDITHYLGLPELGVIPVGEPLGDHALVTGGSQLLLGNRGGNGNGNVNGSSEGQRIEMAAWGNKNSLIAESYRTTLTSILFSRQNADRARVLVFTSASPKEGKTTTVCNLGIALAEIHHRVLLIDGDMRRPRLHNVFGIDNRAGLTDLLLQKTPLDLETLEAACQGTRVPGLLVMASGGSRHNASSLLHSARLPELLHLARERFDTVIVDTPPMVNLADARVVARLADGLIMVVRSGATTRDAALMATSRFAEDGIPILGSVLNFWNPKSGSSYYRYYYSGYYDYYSGSDNDGDGGNGAGKNDEQSNGDHRSRKRQLRLRPDFNHETLGT